MLCCVPRGAHSCIGRGGANVQTTRVPGDAGRVTSLFRLKKGSEAAMVSFGLDSAGKVSTLGLSPDRDYE